MKGFPLDCSNLSKVYMEGPFVSIHTKLEYCWLRGGEA